MRTFVVLVCYFLLHVDTFCYALLFCLCAFDISCLRLQLFVTLCDVVCSVFDMFCLFFLEFALLVATCV